MSHTYSEFLPSYSVGVDCYKAIPEIVKPYGKKAVAVGGKTAMEKSKKALLEGIKGSDIEIIDFVWYGGDSSYENVEKIKNNPSVQKADMVFGIGGGRAVDTAKTYCALYNKPLFTFPTIGIKLCVMHLAFGNVQSRRYFQGIFVPQSPCNSHIHQHKNYCRITRKAHVGRNR